MTTQQETFMYQMLLHGDKIAAYRTAYPNASESSLKSAANRLLQEPGIGDVIEQKRQALRAELEAEIRAKMYADIAAEIEYKILLTKIIRQQAKIEREVRGANNEPLTLRSDPGFAQMIRAGLVLGAMEGWNMGSLGKQGGRADKSRSLGAKGESGERLQTAIPELATEMTEEEKDAQRRKGKCINYTYKRVWEYYEQYERNNGYRDEHYEKDKQFFLQRALEQERAKGQVTGAGGSSGAFDNNDKTTTILPEGIVVANKEDVKTTTIDNKTKENECINDTGTKQEEETDRYANIGRMAGGKPVGKAPALGTDEAKRYGMTLRANNWLPVQEMWNSANQDVIMGRKGAEYELKKMRYLAGLINNKDPQMHEVAKSYGLELHPDWLHWARELRCRRQ